MKKQIKPHIKAHLIRAVFYLLLLIAVWAIPFAQAKWNTTKPGKRSLRPVIVDISAAADSIQKYRPQYARRLANADAYLRRPGRMATRSRSASGPLCLPGSSRHR